MQSKGPSMKHLLKILWLVPVMVVVVGTSDGSRPVTAQPAVITLNQPFSGTIAGNSDLVLSFAANLPLTQDIVVQYEADGVLLSGHSVVTTNPPATTLHTITAAGGAGSDAPVTRLFLIPAYSRAVPGTSLADRVSRTGEIRLVRPLAGPVSFTLIARAIDPVYLDINLLEPFAIEVTPALPVQVFHLAADITIPFGIEMVDVQGAASRFDHRPEIAVQAGLNAFRYVDLFEGQFINSYPQWHRAGPALA
ncbi:MAG: hypothetical protein MUE40_21350, partial [Anaerolineae bacterium]|nr:hypothetical protein [Anaerolineae bacterium]